MSKARVLFFLGVSVMCSVAAACGDDGGGGAGGGGGIGGGVGGGIGGGGGPDGGDPNALAVTITGASVTSGVIEDLSFACPDLVTCSFDCMLNDFGPVPCTSPWGASLPDEGVYVFHVYATSGDGRTGHATHTITVDRTQPKLLSFAFTAYDEITLTFDEPIDAAALALANFSITAQPTGMAVRSVAAVGAEVRVGLTRLHLPWNGYKFTYEVADLAGNAAGQFDRDLTPDVHSRLAFATATTLTGGMPLPAAVSCAASDGLGRADCVCQHEATQAGMVGTFRAMLSATGNDAFCRMRGLGGTELGHCGLPAATPLPPPGPWVRADGLAVSSDYLNTTGIFFANPGMMLDGQIPASGVWTGSTEQLNDSSFNCTDWSVSASVTGYHTYPLNARLPFMWDKIGSTCNNPFPLLCVQVDAGGLPTKPIEDVPASAKRVFISSTRTNGAISHGSGATGLAAADAICSELASNAGLPGTGYVALLSDSDDDAFCRILGLTGERGATDCGATAEQLATGPFVSVHGHVLAANAAELLGTGAREAYVGTEAAAYQYPLTTWTGIDGNGQGVSPYTCTDWTVSASGGSYLGQPYIAGVPWFYAGAGGNVCSTNAALVCVQR